MSEPKRHTTASVLKFFLESTRYVFASDLDSFTRFRRKDGDVVLAVEKLFACPEDLANKIVGDFRDRLKKQGKAIGTINRRLSALRGLSKKMKEFGVVSWTLDVSSAPPKKFRDLRSLGVEATARIVELAALTDSRARRDLAILLLVDKGKLNRAEICALKLEDYSPLPTHPQVVVKAVPVRLPLAAKKALDAWIEVRGLAPGMLFVGFSGSRPNTNRTLDPDDLVEVVRTVPPVRSPD
jgi:site-specific recombinase XerC